jgi:hypothetical protein
VLENFVGSDTACGLGWSAPLDKEQIDGKIAYFIDHTRKWAVIDANFGFVVDDQVFARYLLERFA